MSSVDGILKNRNLIERVVTLKERLFLASEAAGDLVWEVAPEAMEGGLARIVSRRLRVAGRDVWDIQRTLVCFDEGHGKESDHVLLRENIERAAQVLAYVRPSAKRIRRYFAEMEGPHYLSYDKISCARRFETDLGETHDMAFAAIEDVNDIADAAKREFEPKDTETEDQSSDVSVTRLSLTELAGVLGVDESSLTDAVRGGEKIEGLQVDRWVRGKVDHQPHFQVPNQILRDRGAEALIVDNPLGEDLD